MSSTLIQILLHRFSFAVAYITLIGFSLFFHFYLGHEISEIENWLYYYSGLIMIIISCLRLGFIYLNLENSISSNRVFNYFPLNGYLKVRFSTLLGICSLGLFYSLYFYFLNVENFPDRPQIVPRAIVLFFIVTLDILGSHFLIKDKKHEKLITYGFIDSMIVLFGISFFYQNLQLNLIFTAFYICCYALYLLTKEVGTVLLYWIGVLLPVSIIVHYKIDFFSVDYKDLFSGLIILLGHLITYIWLYRINNKRSYGTVATRHT